MELEETDITLTCAPNPFDRGMFGFAKTGLDFHLPLGAAFCAQAESESVVSRCAGCGN